ncbi:TetR/AcrR family transcriptional regulator [Lactococcus lactis]|uniref:TetR/AcrR family transcriptional regulator n=1 Tax=Lactococcus lactis TaxID=1358 RepID=UPI0021B124A9|nr:TetR/AcrR family transcriptional regulator [Lactococcus lactis]
MKVDNRQKLIKSTDELLKNHSLASITAKEITKRAELSVGVFYNYFESKEDIFQELIKSFFTYSIKEMEQLKGEITGNNIRSEIKFKEFLINGIDKNWENHFLNSDILMVSRKDKDFQKMMMSYNDKMVDTVADILVVVWPEVKERPITLARVVVNMIQNSFPSFSKFETDAEKEEYAEEFVKIIYNICFRGSGNGKL